MKEPTISATLALTAADQLTIRTAAYGAVSLLAAGSSKPHKAATAGSRALLSATGTVGHVLAAKSKDITLAGKSVAELADQVLPALAAAVALLEQSDPAEADNFRTTVQVARGRHRRRPPWPGHHRDDPKTSDVQTVHSRVLLRISSVSASGAQTGEIRALNLCQCRFERKGWLAERLCAKPPTASVLRSDRIYRRPAPRQTVYFHLNMFRLRQH
ncbi:hypothetical protein [Nocardia aobensis]|uniref:hypothetical protein n=1 Tax=Nocardia aobensis TaxID=257277 RepID=UPI0002E5E731|nr:hypothetical protein [Nocardia aobensis]